jgi:cytochrome b561
MAQLRNSEHRYGAASIALHWAAALAIGAMLATAVGIMTAPNEEAEGARIQLHVWTGTSLYLILAARVLWSWLERKPVLIAASPAERSLARIVHAALLVLIALQLVTGPLGVWSGGWPIGAFGMFTIASPFDAPQPWHDAIGEIHEYTGLAIAGLVGLHVAGALKHALVDRDGTLSRMFGLRVKDPLEAPAEPGASTAGATTP